MEQLDKLFIEKYGERALRRSALRIRNGAEIIKYFMCKCKIDIAIEIGTYAGLTSAYMSQFCKKLITIDLKHGRIEDAEVIKRPIRKEIWDEFGIKNIEQVLIENDKEKEQVLGKINFDFAFIDGAHDESVANDFRLVKKCGHVLFHDYDKRGVKDQDYVYNFVNMLPKEELEIKDIFAFWEKK